HCCEAVLLHPVDVSASVDQGAYHVEAFTSITNRLSLVLRSTAFGSAPCELVASIPECSAVHLPHGAGPGREMTTVSSEKYAACCGSKDDDMRLIPARCIRMLQRCTGALYMHLFLIFQEGRSVSNTCNQLPECNLFCYERAHLSDSIGEKIA